MAYDSGSGSGSGAKEILKYAAPVLGAALAGYAAYQLPLTSMSGILAGAGYLAGGMIAQKAGQSGAVADAIKVGSAAAAVQYIGGEGLGMQEGVVLGLGAWAGDYLAAKEAPAM